MGSAFAATPDSQHTQTDPIIVDPTHWAAFDAFTVLHDQWTFRPDGMPYALPANVVIEWLQLSGCSDIPQTYKQVRHIATGALRAIAERREHERSITKNNV